MIYNWHINELEVIPSINGLTNVIKKIKFTYVAKDDIHSAWIRDTYVCPSPNDNDFTTYNDLTEDQVSAWLEGGLDLSSLQSSLIEQIENQKNPPIVNLPLPWAE
jgi:hypothetical protein